MANSNPPNERWLPARGFPGYEVSDLGRVRSLDRVDRFGRVHRGRILRPGNYIGYPFVSLSVNGVAKIKRVHSLVAEAFLGSRPKGLEVNHKNGVKHDNTPSNLEYVTRQGNCHHAYHSGLMPLLHHGSGENNNSAKLKMCEVEEILRLSLGTYILYSRERCKR